MILVLLFLGLAFGSFVNAWVWRLRQQLDDRGEARRLSVKNASALSVVHGRSMCPNCKHVLAWYDLIPVFSWLQVLGKCRYCQRPISRQYPLIELLVGLLFVASYMLWPIELTESWHYVQFATWLGAIVGLVALAVYDAKWTLLPDRIVFPLAAFCVVGLLLQFVLGRPLGDMWGVAGGVAVCSGVFALVYAYASATGRELIGFGDVKLGVVLGLLVSGALQGMLVLFLASLLGCVFAFWLWLRARYSRQQFMGLHIPFGPFLIAATVVVVLYGSVLLRWYGTYLMQTTV